MSEEDKKSYVPPPSVGHELGIMFGFIGLMITAMTVYWVLFQRTNKKHLRIERERVNAYRQQEGIVVNEKERGAT